MSLASIFSTREERRTTIFTLTCHQKQELVHCLYLCVLSFKYCFYIMTLSLIQDMNHFKFYLNLMIHIF